MTPHIMITSLRTAAVLAVLTLWASNANAQVDNRLALGMSVTSRLPDSDGASGSADVGFEIRIGHEKDGWGPQTSVFNWFDTGVKEPVGARIADLGEIRIRPIMVGYGYTKIRGRAAITTDLVGGYSFNSLHLDSAASADYERQVGASIVHSEATNSFVLKPEVQAWYDLTNRWGLRVTAGYLIARPSVKLTTALGEDTRPVRADTFLITLGAVFSIF